MKRSHRFISEVNNEVEKDDIVYTVVQVMCILMPGRIETV